MRTALAAAAVLAMGAAGLGPAAASIPVGDAGRCVDGGSSTARVRPGAQVDEPAALTRVQQRAFEREMRQRLTAGRLLGDLEPGSVTIRVHAHVLRRNNGTGGVSGKDLRNQIRALNRGFSGAESRPGRNTPFRFRLRSVDRTNKTAWYRWDAPSNAGPGDDKRAKRALHKGGRDDLNLYVANLQDNLLGYAYFPNVSPRYLDGVVVHKESLPGGGFTLYDQGDTATHEVGHWLGLFHTFENGCRNPGDRVGDTPRQAAGNNVFVCDATLNTCTARGRDPVHNYMNYTADACINQFTRGQSDRMADVWEAYRAP